MPVVKRSVSFAAEIWEEVARITGARSGRVSALVNAALAYYLHIEQGRSQVAAWEAEHGALTAEELAEADRFLDAAGIARGPETQAWQD
jgi:hypothetical protein